MDLEEQSTGGAAVEAIEPQATPDTRERLVRAAIDVFLEKGYGGSRVQDIASRAGYTAGALYVHFPSRAALLGEAIMMEGRQIVAGMIESVGRVSTADGGISRALAEFTLAKTSHIDVLLLEALALASREEEAREMLGATLADLEDSMVDQIHQATEDGVVDASLDVTAIRAVVSSWVLGMIVRRAVGLGSADFDRTLEVYTRVVGGLAPD
jgi:AcrR family transcriptional regulator